MKDFLRLLALIAPYWKVMLLAAVLGFLAVGSSVGLMATSAFLIASAALHPPVLDLMQPIVGVRFFGISRAVFRYLERYVTHDAAFRILSGIRVQFYRALEPLAPAALIENRSGELSSRIGADVDTLEQFYLRVLAPPLVALVVLAGVFIFLAGFEMRLALVFLVLFLSGAVVVPLGVRLLGRGSGRRMVEARAELNANLVDTIQGMAEIAAFDQAGERQKRIDELSRGYVRVQERAAGVGCISNALVGLTMHLAMWSVLVIAVPLVHQGKLEGVHLAMLALAASAAFEAVLPLPMVFHHLEAGLAAARRIFAVTDKCPAVRGRSGSSLRPANYNLHIRDLCFRYRPEDPPVLDGVSLVLPEGARLAVVGPSGAGKSTLVNLLLRFWDYDQGSITLGGRELRDYAPDDVRSLFSVVTQHTHLFNATVRENLLLAAPGARADQLIEAARAASIHEFIQSLPQGYDTYLGDRGFKLSGGQRQRLAIARALLKDAPILLLDEVSAGLDPVTEREVMEAIVRLMAGRTTLLITHRLHGLEAMDEILVLAHGRVIERGRHAKLIRKNGFYRRMWNLQHHL